MDENFLDALSEYELKIQRAHRSNFLRAVDPAFYGVWQAAKPHTMLSRERLYDFYSSVTYAVRAKVRGDVVEVGTWQGGGCIAAGLAIANAGTSPNESVRTVYGFDTFEGHPKPDSGELDVWGRDQSVVYSELDGRPWAKADYQSVRYAFDQAVGMRCRVELVKGLCQDTIPKYAPKQISVLRLDVDWYAPTLFSLNLLYPRLSIGGILIVDDFGHHSGARQAFDEFFSKNGLQSKIFYTDYSCISLIKN